MPPPGDFLLLGALRDGPDSRGRGNPAAIKGIDKSKFLGNLYEEICMKLATYGEPHILAILRQAEGGVPVVALCQQHFNVPGQSKKRK